MKVWIVITEDPEVRSSDEDSHLAGVEVFSTREDAQAYLQGEADEDDPNITIEEENGQITGAIESNEDWGVTKWWHLIEKEVSERR